MSTDTDIRSDVIAALKWCAPDSEPSEIAVIVHDRAVTLNGTARDWREKLAAERIAKQVKGVRAVANDIEVRLPEDPPADEALAERIARLLDWSSAFRDTSIQAVVHRGRVTLTGEVEVLSQKDLAARRIEDLDGVTQVSNEITVRPPPAPSARELKRQIIGALHRHASVEAANVRVTIVDGNVTLDGTVDAYHERDLIEDAIRHAKGVRQIVDNIEVA